MKVLRPNKELLSSLAVITIVIGIIASWSTTNIELRQCSLLIRPLFLGTGTVCLALLKMRIWIAQSAEGVPKLAFVTWPCHPTSRARDIAPSADFVGVLRQTIREHLGRDVAVIYLSGASGDVRPNMTRHRSLKK